MSPSLLLLLSLSACKDKGGTGPADSGGGDDGGTTATDPFEGVDIDETWEIPGMRCDATVVRTDASVPHIYAHDREDLARVYGFVQARDRYFEMDLARRLGQGRLSEILGADALETDMESRANGMTWVAANLQTNLTDEQRAIMEAFAEGVNAYIAAVKAGELPMPSELEIAGPFLGVEDPTELMTEWELKDLTGVAAVLVYELGYETDDVGRTANLARLSTIYDEGDALADLRAAGIEQDVWGRVDPVLPSYSAHDWSWGGSAVARRTDRMASELFAPVPQDMLDRLAGRLDRFEKRLGRGDLEAGWGSNVWAVGGSVSADGTALLAGDGHLPLSVPSLFWQVGLDTSVLGDGDTHQLGLGIPGLPILAVGTNGKVAWSQTQIMGDITDWYREELILDADGAPSATVFEGGEQPVTRSSESHVIAEVPLLGSEGGTFEWSRYETFDGRWIADIEGTPVADDYSPTAGESVVHFPGQAIVPGDVDGDGVVTAISFDYTAFSDGNILHAVDGFGHSESVEDFAEASKALVAYSQNMGVADTSGSVLYTGYQAVPCRDHLARDADGWLEGADPRLLIDGTTYGGFEIPVGEDGKVVEGETGNRCVVPFDAYPQVIDPGQGYIVNANNDPGGLTLDGSLIDEPYYIGGPWVEGFRAHRIEELIDEGVAAGTADADWMATIQGDHKSQLGDWFAWHLLESIAKARGLSETDGPWTEADARLVALYESEKDALDEVYSRLSTWEGRGFPTDSGVETFYHSPTAEQVEDSIATSLFNAWLSAWDDAILNDEGLPGVWSPGSTTGKVRMFTEMLEGRGEGNPEGLASWNEETGESAFFDVLGTEPVETSHEVALAAMIEGLAFLRSDPGGETRGVGFGTTDMSAYKWGLRHQTRFESVLSDFVGGDDFSFLTDQFSVNTDVLPLDGEAGTDALEWFPRPGDNLGVDAANPGWGNDWTHSSGPVFRMVIELGPDGFVSGRNVIPGGQSALIDSDHFADQTALWLANETVPMQFYVADVIAAATAREQYPGSGECD